MSQVDFESEEILVRARRLDSIALGLLHDRYYPDVYRYVCYRLADAPAGAAITAEVFLRLLHAIDHCRAPRRNLLGWLLSTARTQVEGWLRQNSEHRNPYINQKFRGIDRSDQELWLAMQKLSWEKQHFLALRFSKLRTLEQVAHIMELSVKDVRRLQYHTLSSLNLSRKSGSATTKKW